MADVGVTPYNSSLVPDTGGDSYTQDVNVYYDVSLTGSSRVGFGHTRRTDNGIGGRHCVDDHSHRTCLAHDSRCWVRPFSLLCATSTNLHPASSIPAWREGSPLCL